jgi:hypothetical protein
MHGVTIKKLIKLFLSFLYTFLQWENYTTQNTTMNCRNFEVTGEG